MLTTTQPYFTRPDEEQPYYDMLESQYRSLPAAPYPLLATVRAEYHGVAFAISRYVQSMQRVEALGLRAYPLQVAPAISVQVSPAAGALPLTSKEFSFAVTLRSNVKKPAEGTLKLDLPAGWKSEPAEYHFITQREGDTKTVTFEVEPRNIKAEAYTIKATAQYGGRTYEEGYQIVGYPGLRPTDFFRPATYRAVGVDVKTAPNLTVAYIPGTGDDVARGLEDLGINVHVLPADEAAQTNLAELRSRCSWVSAPIASPK